MVGEIIGWFDMELPNYDITPFFCRSFPFEEKKQLQNELDEEVCWQYQIHAEYTH